MRGFFVTGTGTGEGKTFVTRGLARHAHRRGIEVAALKPLETGVVEHATDAEALARASGRPELASLPGLYRVAPAVSPFTATRRGLPPVPSNATLREVISNVSAELWLVEGAGGVLVPLDAERSIADLIAALGLPAVLVARNGLGVLSHTRAAYEALTQRAVHVAAIVLTEHGVFDESQQDNLAILSELLPTPVVRFPSSHDDDDALAESAADVWVTLAR
ncbi:MAG: dethiobiotin synthase [Sandaracinaceae bacterium]|nr:dethiobiotin synthase [Sandaracinaceae bacterium]MBP7683565.1 dethiobiotin synthase [Deltaproteobacteria bacterium]MBK6812034.1 dethiobiotin synthase [Sandaracinaceae bacterium]MBK7154844.1 dethiobiotin synthase [Sandaracinaceae bacterium]MBK7775047.1 dethiobiotin synthase [Sandaracinaceae bacterium]